MMAHKNDVKKNDILRNELISFDDLDTLFDEFLSRRWPRLFDWNFPPMSALDKNLPKVDLIDHDNELEVQAALPGVNKEDLNVSINNQSLTIQTTTQKETKEEGKYFRREISRGEYQRTLTLPENVDINKSVASFKDGILKITLPKTEKTKSKKIEIQ